MQQAGGGGGGGSQSPQSHLAAEAVEAASPISSRPPASTTVNLDEFMALSGSGGAGGGSVFGGGDDEALAMAAAVAESDRGGGLVGGSSGSGGNRWPRPETLALLTIRSEMDAIFRDATLKGPLWEDVSRKMAELGYKRNAKKCKEKFENVHKYYKRTKEGRAGRQDGKSYKFFSQLEALHGNVSSSQGVPTTTVTPSAVSSATTAQLLPPPPTPFSVTVNPIPISSFRASPSHLLTNTSQPPPTMDIFPRDHLSTPPTMPISAPPTTATTSNILPMGVSFSSNSCSSLPGSDDDDEDTEGEAPFNVGSSRKRKRDSSKRGGTITHRMMEFFEKLMKQVMQKQETMQQKFVEVIEKREQERMIREEAWKRQEMARMSREHEVIAQERALSASRDSAIVSFLQKITGQTIPLPTQLPPVAVNLHAVPSPVVVQPAPSVPTPDPPPSMHQQQQHQQQSQVVQVNRQSADQQVVRYQPSASSEPVMAVPERQVAPQDYNTSGAGSSEKGSSRWPKTEVLALINLRSGMETKYQESGPKGPLWEEISAGMQQLGYKRNAKRCKEKWENINKYFKKVKESNKRRPEDSKTCPYFHQLDALYRQKVFGGSSTTGGESSSGGGSLYNQNRPEQQQQQQQEENIKLDSTPVSQPQQQPQSTELENRNTSKTDVQIMSNLAPNLFGESSTGGAVTNKKPEDIVKQLMDQHEQEETQQQLEVDDYDKIDDEADSDNIDDQEEEDEDTEELEDDESNKMDYKIEFQQRQNTTGPSNDGSGNGATPSFFAMVQ